jgi:hypothetical protein
VRKKLIHDEGLVNVDRFSKWFCVYSRLDSTVHPLPLTHFKQDLKANVWNERNLNFSSEKSSTPGAGLMVMIRVFESGSVVSFAPYNNGYIDKFRFLERKATRNLCDEGIHVATS